MAINVPRTPPGSDMVRGDEPSPLPAAHPARFSRRTYSADYKLAMLRAYERLDQDGRRELLRSEGLHTSLLSAWGKQRDCGALAELGKQRGRRPTDPIVRENARLREANERLTAAFTRANQVIELQGKLSALLEEIATGSDAQECQVRCRTS